MSHQEQDWKSLPVKIHVCTGHRTADPEYNAIHTTIKDLETFHSTLGKTLTLVDLCNEIESKLGTSLANFGITVPDNVTTIFVYETSFHNREIPIVQLTRSGRTPVWTEAGINQYKRWDAAMPVNAGNQIAVTKPYVNVVLNTPEIRIIVSESSGVQAEEGPETNRAPLDPQLPAIDELVIR